jgi:ribosomal protein L16 Arg81 hydroxylase
MPGLDIFGGRLSAKKFLSEFWEKKSLLLKASTRRDARPFGVEFDEATFKRLATLVPSGGLRAQYRDADGKIRQFVITAEQIEPVFENGMTVQLTNIQRVHAELALLTDRIRADLNFAGHLSWNSFLSPASSGYGVHWDRLATIVVQIAGTKVWKYGPTPARSSPPADLIAVDWRIEGFREEYPWVSFRHPEDETFCTRTLRPGDILYLPSGTWHEALADDYSLSLNLGFRLAPLYRVLAAHLETLLASKPCFQWTPPPMERSPTRFVDLPKTVQEHLRHCVAELSTTVSSSIDTDDLAALCYPAFGSANLDTADDQDARESNDIPFIRETDLLAVPRLLSYETSVMEDVDGENVLLFRSGEKVCQLAIGALLLVQNLLKVSRFTMRDVVRWPGVKDAYSRDDVRDMLGVLVQQGFIERLTDPSRSLRSSK